jgi:sarcosine oxidase subunit delta
MMNCPLNGLRNISEFVYGGQVKAMPDHRSVSDADWADYVFFEDTAIGVVREWWQHAPSSYWFIAERHNGSDEILRTFDPSELYTARVDFESPELPQS